MRKRRWLLGAGIVGTGLVLAVLGQRGWGQSGELPGLPPSPRPTVTKEPDMPSRPSLVESAPLPPAPVLKLPPPTVPPAPVVAPSSPRAPETVPMLPARIEPVSGSSLGEALPSAKHESMVIVEWIGAPIVQLNQPFSCQIVVRNTGPAAAHQVTVRHRLSPGVTCKQSEPAAATQGDELIWTVGTLQPGQQRRLHVQFVASQRGALNCQATATFAASAGQQIQVREPLLVVKLQAPEKGIAGE